MNTKSRTLAILTAVLFVAGAAVVFVPGAEAQLAQQCGNAVKATLKHDSFAAQGRIKPITESYQIKSKIYYTAPESARSLVPVTISIDAKPDNAAWATVTVAPKTVDVPVASQGATNEPIEITITVALNKNAPAFAEQNIRLTASATQGTCVEAPIPIQVDIPIKADFYERYQAQFERAVWKTGQNSQVQIPLTIQNFGNGDIQVRITVNELTSRTLSVTVPAQITVKSIIGGGDTDRETANIDVQTPFKNGYTNQRDSLVLDLKGNSADDTNLKLTELQLNAIIQTQGVYVPGFETVTMITALLGAVLAARRLQ